MSTFTFQVKNGNDEIYVDTTHKVYQLFEEVTITGSWDSVYLLYKYSTSSSVFDMVLFEPGTWIGKTFTGYYISNKSSLTFRKLKVSDDIAITNGTSHGIHLFNELGELTFSSLSPVGTIKDVRMLNFTVVSTTLFTDIYPSNPNLQEITTSYMWLGLTGASSLNTSGKAYADTVYRKNSTTIVGKVGREFGVTSFQVVSAETTTLVLA